MTEQTKGIAIKPYEPITIRQFPNNGWIIQQGGYMGEMPSGLGAYTDTKDMLYALTEALLDETRK